MCSTRHTRIGRLSGDEPLYPGKSRDLFQATLQGGETYFLQVREDGTTLPLAVERDQAEAYLKAAHAQRHVLSRASTVEACRHYGFLETQKVADRDYSFTTERLFVGGKLVMSASGKQALKQFIEDLQKDGVPLREVHIEGHTDPLGDEAENQLLGLRRANAVREALIAQGFLAADQCVQQRSSRSGGGCLLRQPCRAARVLRAKQPRGVESPDSEGLTLALETAMQALWFCCRYGAAIPSQPRWGSTAPTSDCCRG